MQIKRIGAALAAAFMLAGCAGTPAPTTSTAAQGPAQPAPPTAPAPAVPVTFTAPLPRATQVWTQPSAPLTDHLPTYPTEPPQHEWSVGLNVVKSGELALQQVAAQLAGTGKPEPPGAVPTFVGQLEGGHYVYATNLGRDPQQGHVYMLQQEAGGWTATPICQEASLWIWPGTRDQTSPVVICGGSQGSGEVLTLAVYKGGREVFRAAGLEQGVVQVGQPKAAGAPPPLVLTGKLQVFDHKLDPWVTERFTLEWQGDTYGTVKHERMADANYHLARFVKFLAAGDLPGAAGEFAAPPAAGMAAYLQQHAPQLQAAASMVLTSEGRDGYLVVKGTDWPWFHFDFAADGRIKAVQETAQSQVGNARWA